MSVAPTHPVFENMQHTRAYFARQRIESANHIATCDKPITNCWACSNYFQITPGGS